MLLNFLIKLQYMESKYYVMHIQLSIGYSKTDTCYFVSVRAHNRCVVLKIREEMKTHGHANISRLELNDKYTILTGTDKIKKVMSIGLGKDQSYSYFPHETTRGYCPIDDYNLISGKIPTEVKMINNVPTVADAMREGSSNLQNSLSTLGVAQFGDSLFSYGHTTDKLDNAERTPEVKFITTSPTVDDTVQQQKRRAGPMQKSKIKNRKKNKVPNHKDVLDGILKKASLFDNNDVFQKRLEMPTMRKYTFASNIFVVAKFRGANSCDIGLGEVRSTSIRVGNTRNVELGLDLSLQERRLLYNCLEETSAFRQGHEICYLTVKQLYKDHAVLTISGQDYVARYSALKELALSPAASPEKGDKGTFWADTLRWYDNKDNSHPFLHRTPIPRMTAPIYHKFTTKKITTKTNATLICSEYFCDKCKIMLGTTTPLEHFNEKHTDIQGLQIYAQLLTQVINKRNKESKETEPSFEVRLAHHANRAIRSSMKSCNLIPSSTDFFRHGVDPCMKELDSYFDTILGAAKLHLDKNKGEIHESVPETGVARTKFFQDVMEQILLRLEHLKKYPWHVLYSNLSYDSKLTSKNKDLNLDYEEFHDQRSDIMHGLIIGCVHGTYDKTTHPVLELDDDKTTHPVLELDDDKTTHPVLELDDDIEYNGGTKFVFAQNMGK